MTSDGDTVFVWTWLPGATEPVVAGTVTFRSGSYANQGDTEDKLVRKALSLAKRKRSTELSVGVYADTDAVPSPYNRLGFEVGYIGLAMPL